MSNTPTDPLKPARDAAFLKLGRCIALFQQVERLLKGLIAHSVVAGASEPEVAANHAARRASVQQRTMGELVGRYRDQVLGPEPACPFPASDLPKVGMRTSFRIEDDNYLKQKEAALGALVGRRNRLVHCLIDDFDLFNAQAIAALDASLDPLVDQLRAEVVELNSVAESMQAMHLEMAAYLGSPAGREAIDRIFLQSSRIVSLMREIHEEVASADGWADLSKAASLVRARAPEELAELKSRYGHARLKPLLLASNCFDLAEEVTERGSTRVVYRPRAAADTNTIRIRKLLPTSTPLPD